MSDQEGQSSPSPAPSILSFEPDNSQVQLTNSTSSKSAKSHPEVELVKCSNVPYIVEEKEILQQINIVKNVKNMFTSGGR